MSPVRIATRRSDLALWQARHIAARIESELGETTELVPLVTSGDRLTGPLAKVGGKGLFVKEIEQALQDGAADVAVHSAKDLPAALAPGLALVAIPLRADPRDALCGRTRGVRIESLPQAARVGTGSARRGAQLLLRRPDLEIVPLRGNVPTRLSKLETLGLDAVVLATAGLERLSLADRIDERIAPELLLPAVAQGALAVQARADDPLATRLAALGHDESAACVAAERGFLVRVGGDCNVPLAAHAERSGAGRLRLRALVIAPDASRLAESQQVGSEAEAAALGARAGDEVLAKGGDAILATLRAESGA